MTITPQKMLDRAEELEQQARTLRAAVALMNGHLTDKKQPGHDARLQAAIAERKTQRYIRAGSPDAQARETLIRDLLAQGPQGTKAVVDHLAPSDYPLTREAIRKLLKTMPDVVQTGNTRYARWQLLEELEKRAGVKGNPTPVSRYQRRKAYQKIDASEKWATVLGILRDHGGPMKIAALRPAARAAGIPSLTGLYTLVLQGCATKTKQGYRFKHMPEPSEAAPS